MSVTIKDVALAAGVSASTVSRALSRPEKVEPATRQRIMELAHQLGYRPNRAAQILNTGRTGCLGAILPDLENPFFAGLLKGIENAAGELGYQILVADTGEDAAAERRAIEALAGRTDGLLLCASRLEDDEIRRIDHDSSVVLVNRSVPGVRDVSFDNGGGMHQAWRHLLALGHQRIGYVGGTLLSRSAQQRLTAFEALAQATPGPERGCVLGEFAPTFDGGGAAADHVLRAEVTAAIVYNDIMAIGLMHMLTKYGFILPDRLSVVSFDDIPVSSLVTPPLSTVSLPRHEAGRLATQTLVAARDSEGGSSAVLGTHLVPRASTRSILG